MPEVRGVYPQWFRSQYIQSGILPLPKVSGNTRGRVFPVDEQNYVTELSTMVFLPPGPAITEPTAAMVILHPKSL